MKDLKQIAAMLAETGYKEEAEAVLQADKDVARYRWLRLGASSNRVPHITQWPARRGEDYAQISIVGIDEAIDTAMQANKD